MTAATAATTAAIKVVDEEEEFPATVAAALPVVIPDAELEIEEEEEDEEGVGTLMTAEVAIEDSANVAELFTTLLLVVAGVVFGSGALVSGAVARVRVVRPFDRD